VEADVTFLAADRLEGRGVGTAGLDSAAAYVAARFEDVGLQPGEPGGYLQDFRIDSTAPAAAHAGLGGAPVTNIVGFLPGSGSLAGEVVVVGAHYDHLGLGTQGGSLDPDSTGVVHNGADDNASGTAALIDIAARLASRTAPDHRRIVFVAFTAEELGLIGSDYYAKHPPYPADSTFAMVNLDMVGRLRDRRLAAFGTETATQFTALLDSVNARHQLDITTGGDGFGRSDHQSFYVTGVPVVHFFTGTHEDYHRTTDDPGTLNFPGVLAVDSLVSDFVWALATRRTPLDFVEVAPPREVRAPAGGERPYLGTIPDMTGTPGGVRLNGVTSGSPADEAGLRTGDILIGLGDHPVGDLFDMTDALNAYRPGDTVTLRVKRDGREVTLTATLRSR